MAILSIYSAGVPTSGIEYISAATKETFGDCSIMELGKDKLRSMVRRAYRDSSVVLVVLDTESMNTCKDIENGLYSSEKFYNYIDNAKLVDFLNDTYDTSIEYVEEEYSVDSDSEEVSNISPDDRDALVEKYTSQLADKEAIISNLSYRIKELEVIIDSCGYSTTNSDLEDEKSKNTELRETISILSASESDLKKKLENTDTLLQASREALSDTNKRIGSLSETIDSLNKDLSAERVTSSQKSAVIRDKDREIGNLNTRISELEAISNTTDHYKTQCSELEKVVKDLRSTVGSLTIDLDAKKAEVEKLTSDLKSKGNTAGAIETYQRLLKEQETRASSAEKKLRDLEGMYTTLLTNYELLSDSLDVEKRKYEGLYAKYQESEKYLNLANKDKVELLEKNRVLSEAVSKDSNLDNLTSELTEIRRKYAELQRNVFNVISTKALPRSNVSIPLYLSMRKYKNIRFQFSGSAESRKGTYKCLYNELLNAKGKYLIVDVTSETAVDYVFQMRKVVDGLNWYSLGGNVQNYTSATCLPNVRVLVSKIGYINDSYFLTVDWDARLQELENSGYKVIIYCGDISNLVSRVLFEAFSQAGHTRIYVHGNALGSRSILANAGGLTGIKNSIVGYFDYDKSISRFYDMMGSKCKCTILSSINGINVGDKK